jgi:hypothetical protein
MNLSKSGGVRKSPPDERVGQSVRASCDKGVQHGSPLDKWRSVGFLPPEVVGSWT